MQGRPLGPSEKRGLPLEEKTIAQHLKGLGYATHIVGKWHLGYYKTEYTPLQRGFDSHIGYWNAMISYYDHVLQDLWVRNSQYYFFYLLQMKSECFQIM